MRMVLEEIASQIILLPTILHSMFSTPRQYPQYGLSVHTSIGWESLEPNGGQKDDGFSGFISLTRIF